MPIYEYKCAACGKEFEQLVPNAEKKVNCPDCESGKVSRKLSAFSAVMGNSCPSKSSCPSAGGGGCSRSSSGCGCGMPH